MNKYIKWIGQALEIMDALSTAHEPSEEEKIAYNEGLDRRYNPAFYSGSMGPMELQSWKNTFKYKI